ncbi:MAG: DEAD/DEAH box helicase [Candidatus Woesearchaeota archaeon]
MKFTQIPLQKQLQQALTRQGYTEPTPIQQQAIPLILQGEDVLGIAQTGTGKTAAFCLPILSKLMGSSSKPKRPRALIITPTRELAAQILASLNTYGTFANLRFCAVFGGVSQGPQVKQLNNGVDVLVATPGRLLDLMQQKHITLSETSLLVLDEADRMLDMGFINDIKEVVKQTPPKRQTLLFSATMPKAVEQFAQSILRSPKRVEVASESTTADNITQKVLFVDHNKRDNLLLHLFKQEQLHKVLVFTKMKHRASKVATLLSKNGIKAVAIHGDKSQNQRTQALARFSQDKVRVLVGTDVAARGLDVDDISHVINYELPMDVENYVHRIGRTARAGASGVAYSFSGPEDKLLLQQIESLLGHEIEIMQHKFHSETARRAPAKKKSSKRSFKGTKGGRGGRSSKGSKGSSQKGSFRKGFRKGSKK